MSQPHRQGGAQEELLGVRAEAEGVKEGVEAASTSSSLRQPLLILNIIICPKFIYK